MKHATLIAAILWAANSAAFASLDDRNVVSDSPSRDSYDSMPLSGSHGAGANCWFQDGALWFYPGHSGAQNENSCLLKLGALRLTPEGADFKSPKRFRQELDLPSGSIRIEAEAQDGTTLDARLWFAGETLVVEMKFSRALSLLAEYGSWRVKPDDAPTAREQVTPKDGALYFVHRNGHCERVFSKAKSQNVPESALVNPVEDRVFGGVLAARGGLTFALVVPVQWQIWKGHAWPAKTIAANEQLLTVALGAAQNADPAQWAARAGELLEPAALARAKAGAQKRWDEFWGRSHVFIRPGGDTNDPVAQIGRNYQRYRFISACNQGGELPLRFNGGIFCSDPRIERVPERLNNLATLSFSRGANPDFMRWGNDIFFGQNQRWIGWPTLANGDADLLRPCIAYYRDRLPTAQARARNLKAAGACYIEMLDLEGLCSVTPTSQGLSSAPHITYHFSMGLEHARMTLRGRSVSGTDLRADLPWMVEQICFFDSFYRAQTKARTGNELTPDGRLCLYPCNGLELVVKATNPIETVAALRAVVSALLELPELPAADREFLKQVQPTLPELPVMEKKWQRILNLADKWEGLANGWEFPEMFPAWPYRLVGVLHPETLPLCRATWDSQELRGDNQHQASSPWEKGGKPGGPGPLQKRDWSWQSTMAYAAALGLTEETAEYAVTKLSDRASACSFPACFGPGHDWMPDIEWGGCASTGLQEMLLACDEKKILLLPAWPRGWDVDFKLHAPQQTTVECEVKGGKIVRLEVTPESRRNDVIVALGQDPATTNAAARFIQQLRAGRKQTIATLGTSLTGGTWRWVSVMQEWLDADFPGLARIQNLGVGASGSSHPPGQSGLDTVKRAAALIPDVVFIEFAVNDAYLPYHISLADSQRNLNTMVDTILQANPDAEVIVQTTNPVIDMPDAVNRHPTNRPRLVEYCQGYRDVARERGLILVDHYPNWQRLLLSGRDEFLKRVPDGIHPQEPGYREIFLPELKRVLLGAR